jgi:hypothetical protein
MDGEYSLSLEAGSYKQDIFEAKGLLGNGYDWTKLAEAFIAAQMPELEKQLAFNPEANMFSVSSRNQKAIKMFAEKFKAACNGGIV